MVAEYWRSWILLPWSGSRIAVTPDGDALVVNTLDGAWCGGEGTQIVLRRVRRTGQEVDRRQGWTRT